MVIRVRKETALDVPALPALPCGPAVSQGSVVFHAAFEATA